MSKSLYALYIEEREGSNIIENEKGFITFFKDKEEMVIRDCFVKKEYRSQNIALNFVDQVVNIAKEEGLYKITTHVDKDTKGWKESKRKLEAYGFSEVIKNDTMILLSKDL